MLTQTWQKKKTRDNASILKSMNCCRKEEYSFFLIKKKRKKKDFFLYENLVKNTNAKFINF